MNRLKGTLLITVASTLIVCFYLLGNLPHEKWLIFDSDNPALQFTFEYPESWKPVELKGRTESYDEVQVFGPRDELLAFSTAYSITVKEVKPDVSAKNLLDDYLKRLAQSSNFKTEKMYLLHSLGTSVVEYGYELRLPIRKPNASNVKMRGKALCLMHKDKAYRINFLGTDEQYKKNVAVFNRALETFRFKNPSRT